eukprot:SAG31_NODE_1225_length_9271_cov_10.376472_10_plen_60_part_00
MSLGKEILVGPRIALVPVNDEASTCFGCSAARDKLAVLFYFSFLKIIGHSILSTVLHAR